MKPEYRKMAVLLAVFLLLLTWTLVVKLGRHQTLNPGFITGLLRDISGFTDTTTEKIVLRSPAGSEVIISRSGGQWHLPLKENLAADRDSMANLFIEFAKLPKGDLVSDKPEHYNTYDLGETQAATIILTAGAKTVTLRIGKIGSYSGSTYVRIEGKPYVFLMPCGLHMFIDRFYRDWYDKQVYDVDPDEIKSYAVIRGGQKVLTATRADTEWVITDNLKVINKQQVQELVEQISILRAVDVYPQSELTPVAAGLDKPRFVIEFATAATRQELLVGSELPDGTYVAVAGKPSAIYKIASYSLKQLILE